MSLGLKISLIFFSFQFVAKNEKTKYVETETIETNVFKPVSNEDSEMCHILEAADMKDVQEIADILGVIYQGDCKAEELTFYPVEVPNDINFDDIINRIEKNDPILIEVTLNNVKNLHPNQWRRLFSGHS